LRDGNVLIVLLDLALNSQSQLNKIPSPVWYRFQRIIESSGATVIVMTPHALVAPAEVRVNVQAHVDLMELEAEQAKLLMRWDFSVTKASDASLDQPLRKTA
jgi:hypothetical protein